jgi:hypothetical protein
MTSPGADSNLCYYSPVTQMQMRMQMRSTGLSLVRCLTSGLVLSCVPLAAREDEEIPLTALVKALQRFSRDGGKRKHATTGRRRSTQHPFIRGRSVELASLRRPQRRIARDGSATRRA